MSSYESLRNINREIIQSHYQLTIILKNLHTKFPLIPDDIKPNELISKNDPHPDTLNPDTTYNSGKFLDIFQNKALNFQILLSTLEGIKRKLSSNTSYTDLSIKLRFADICFQVGKLFDTYKSILANKLFSTLSNYFFDICILYYNVENSYAEYKLFLFTVETYPYYDILNPILINVYKDILSKKRDVLYDILFFKFISGLTQEDYDKLNQKVNLYKYHIRDTTHSFQFNNNNIFVYPHLDIIKSSQYLFDENVTPNLDNVLLPKNIKCILAFYLFERYDNSILPCFKFYNNMTHEQRPNIHLWGGIKNWIDTIRDLLKDAIVETKYDTIDRNKTLFLYFYFNAAFYGFYKSLNFNYISLETEIRDQLDDSYPIFKDTSYYYHFMAYYKTILLTHHNFQDEGILTEITSLYRLAIENTNNIQHIQLITKDELYFYQLTSKIKDPVPFYYNSCLFLLSLLNTNHIYNSLFFIYSEMAIQFNKLSPNLYQKEKLAITHVYYNKYCFPTKIPIATSYLPHLSMIYYSTPIKDNVLFKIQHIINHMVNIVHFIGVFREDKQLAAYVQLLGDYFYLLSKKPQAEILPDNLLNLKTKVDKLIKLQIYETKQITTDLYALLYQQDTYYQSLDIMETFGTTPKNPLTKILLDNFIKNNYEHQSVALFLSDNNDLFINHETIESYIIDSNRIFYSILDIKLLLYCNVDFSIEEQEKFALDILLETLEYGYNIVFKDANNNDLILSRFIELLFIMPEQQDVIFSRLKILSPKYITDNLQLLEYNQLTFLSFNNSGLLIPFYNTPGIRNIAKNLSSIDPAHHAEAKRLFPNTKSNPYSFSTMLSGFFGGASKNSSYEMFDKMLDTFKNDIPDPIPSGSIYKTVELKYFLGEGKFDDLYNMIERLYRETDAILDSLDKYTLELLPTYLYKCINNVYNGEKCMNALILYIHSQPREDLEQLVLFKNIYFKQKILQKLIHLSQNNPSENENENQNENEDSNNHFDYTTITQMIESSEHSVNNILNLSINILCSLIFKQPKDGIIIKYYDLPNKISNKFYKQYGDILKNKNIYQTEASLFKILSLREKSPQPEFYERVLEFILEIDFKPTNYPFMNLLIEVYNLSLGPFLRIHNNNFFPGKERFDKFVSLNDTLRKMMSSEDKLPSSSLQNINRFFSLQETLLKLSIQSLPVEGPHPVTRHQVTSGLREKIRREPIIDEPISPSVPTKKRDDISNKLDRLQAFLRLVRQKTHTVSAEQWKTNYKDTLTIIYGEDVGTLKEARNNKVLITKVQEQIRIIENQKGGTGGSLFDEEPPPAKRETPSKKVRPSGDVKQEQFEYAKQLQLEKVKLLLEDSKVKYERLREDIFQVSNTMDDTVTILERVFRIINYLHRPFLKQPKIYSWELYQDNIVNGLITLKSEDKVLIEQFSSKFKRYIGKPIVPDHVDISRDDEFMFKQVSIVMRGVYDNLLRDYNGLEQNKKMISQ